MDEDILTWKGIPKIELHAHLNGCVRSSTLLELASNKKNKGTISDDDIEKIICKETRSLSECFRLFPLIHALTTDHSIVTRITKETIEDFASENVIYLELRTTPKCNEVHGMSKYSYVRAVLAGIEAARESNLIINRKERLDCTNVIYQGAESGAEEKYSMHVRLILSIDRRESAAAAMETVLLALDMRSFGIVGIDLSGDPSIGQWETFLPALNWAKQHGLPFTLHCGEVSNPKEVREMLAVKPQRLGHVCCLDEPEWIALLHSKIPVEICLTSNLKTQSVSTLSDHHFVALYQAQHPIILCTDDPGLFSTSLSHEFSLASTYFGLSKMDLFNMERNAINYTFVDDELKQILVTIFEESFRNLFDQNCY